MLNAVKYGSYMKEILKGRLLHKNIPIFVVICITNRCNLRCKYCYAEYYDRNYSEFTTKQLLDLIDELVSMGTKYISLNGGEALLRRDIDVIVDKIKEKNILCHLSTNGLFIKNNIDIIKKIDSLAISIDGDREGNDANRGSGTHDKIMESIVYLHKHNIKFHTHTVLTKNNKNAVNEILTLAQKYNFLAQFSPLRKQDSPEKNLSLDDNDLKMIIKKIIDYKKTGLPIFFSAKAYQALLDWPFSYEKEMVYHNIPKDYKTINCYLKRFYCHVEANGLVYPCIVLINKFRALNFLKVGFKKAWENIANIECKGCYNVCCNDHNLIFGFKPDAIWNAIKVKMNRL